MPELLVDTLAEEFIRVGHDDHYFAHLDVREWVTRRMGTWSPLCGVEFDLYPAMPENAGDKPTCGACIDIATNMLKENKE